MSLTVPGPAGHPVVGMGPAFLRDILGTLQDGFRDYGDVVAYPMGLRRGPLRYVLVAAYHPDGVRQVLTDRGFDRRTTAFTVLSEAIGDGLLTADGGVWERQRRTLQPLFTPRRVAGYAALMADEAERVLAEPGVRDAGVADLYQLMLRYTLRVVGRALFGDDIDDVIGDLLRLVPQGSDAVRARSLAPLRLPLAVPTPRNRRFRRVSAAQYALVDRILARRRARPAPRDADDLVSRLLTARDPDTGHPLSEREIRDQALVFLLAGHETTACALTFTLHLLARHPEIQDEVAAEAGSGASELARAAVQEGMRLYPPAYVTQRRAAHEIELGGHHVPRGTTILASAWVTHRHPAFWPDPERFDPRRFVGRTDRPRYAYFPFGGGPHNCIGEHFALLEAVVLLQRLLARYRVRPVADAAPRLAPLVALRPADPLRVRLTARRGP